MSDTARDYPAIMHDATTTVPVIIAASDYADAVRVADTITGPGHLWHGFDTIVLDAPRSYGCQGCGQPPRHCVCG